MKGRGGSISWQEHLYPVWLEALIRVVAAPFIKLVQAVGAARHLSANIYSL